MTPIGLPAILATATLGLAAWRPGRTLAMVAALLCVLAVVLHLPRPGAGGLALMVAAGLAIASAGVAASAARPLLLVALVWSLTATLAPKAWLGASWSVVLVSCLAAGLTVVAVAAVMLRVVGDGHRRARIWIAILLALAPVGSGGPLLPMGAAVELPLADGAGAWLQTAYLAFDPTALAPWAPLMWRAMPAILLGMVLAAAIARSRRVVLIAGLLAGLLIAAVAVAWWPVAAAFNAGEAVSLVAPGQPFGGSLRTFYGQPAVDVGPLMLLLARWLSALALLVADDGVGVRLPLGRRLDGLALVLGGLLLLGCALLAPAWAGPTWAFDPAAMAALAAFACSFGVLSASGRGADAQTWRVLQAAAATLVVGGGEVGWRVASALMLD